MPDNAMRLSEVLKQFASEAPWIQVEIQRATAQLYSKVTEHLMEVERNRKGGALTEKQEQAVREVAREITPSYSVPAMNAKVQLGLARVSRRGWLLQKRTTSEETDLTIDMTLEAAPMSPLAAMADVLPPTPEALDYESELTPEEVRECKRLMAGTAAEDGAPGERIELVARYLSGEESNWHDIWHGSDAAYERLADNVEGAEWGNNYRDAMRAILRRVLLVEGLEQTGHGKRMRDYIRHLEQPVWLFLRHLRVMKYIQDSLLLRK